MGNNKKIIYISYNREKSFILTLLIETNRGVVPYAYTINEIADFYPYVAEKLKNGMIVYKDFNHGCIGRETYEGPYCEEKTLITEYETINNDLNELLFNLDEKIRNNEKSWEKTYKDRN